MVYDGIHLIDCISETPPRVYLDFFLKKLVAKGQRGWKLRLEFGMRIHKSRCVYSGYSPTSHNSAESAHKPDQFSMREA